MWTFLLSLLLLRRFGIPKPLGYAFAVFIVGLILAVLIYTANLFLTLEQRTSAPDVHTHNTH